MEPRGKLKRECLLCVHKGHFSNFTSLMSNHHRKETDNGKNVSPKVKSLFRHKQALFGSPKEQEVSCSLSKSEILWTEIEHRKLATLF